jgi:hypothetical protein
MSSGDRLRREFSPVGQKRGRSSRSGKTRSFLLSQDMGPGTSAKALATQQQTHATSSQEPTQQRARSQDTRGGPASHVLAGSQRTLPAQWRSPAARSREQSQSSDNADANEEQIHKMINAVEQLQALSNQLSADAHRLPHSSGERRGEVSNPITRQVRSEIRLPTEMVDDLERALDSVSNLLWTKKEVISQEELRGIVKEISEHVSDPRERLKVFSGMLKNLERYSGDIGQGDAVLYAKIKQLTLTIRNERAEARKMEGKTTNSETGESLDDFVDTLRQSQPDDKKRLGALIKHLEGITMCQSMHPRTDSLRQIFARVRQAIHEEERTLGAAAVSNPRVTGARAAGSQGRGVTHTPAPSQTPRGQTGGVSGGEARTGSSRPRIRPTEGAGQNEGDGLTASDGSAGSRPAGSSSARGARHRARGGSRDNA